MANRYDGQIGKKEKKKTNKIKMNGKKKERFDMTGKDDLISINT